MRPERRPEQDLTVVLPAVDPDATMVLPVVQPTTPDDTTASVTRNSAVMAVGSLVSRLTGFIRTVAIGAAIGARAFSDDYTLANTLPNMVYELLLGGVLASVVVPLLVRARTRDSDRGEAYTQRLLSLATIFLAGATGVAVLLAPLLTELVAGSSSEINKNLTTVLGYLLLPEIFFYGVAALLAAILNTRGHFAAPMWTPILNNVVVIATAGAFILIWSDTRELSPEQVTTGQILVLGVGTTLGIVVQAAGLLPALRRVGFRWRWRWDWRALHLRELGRVGGWMLVYVAVSQVALLVVLRLAKMAADRGGPGPMIFNNAYLIFMMAHGVVAVSIITALLPRMATAAAEHRYGDVAAQLSVGTRLSAVILIPATAVYVILGRQLGVALFQFRSYGHADSVATGWVIAAAGIGLVPFAISQLQVFAFYALPDTKTPALLNVPVAALRIALDVVLYVGLAAGAVAAGLMIGNAVSFVAATGIGYWLLRRRLGPLGLTQVFGTLLRLTVAAVIAAIPAVLVTLILVHAIGLGKLASVVELIVGGLMLVIVYLAAAVSLKVREVSDVWGMVRSRLRG
ncbi:MAG: murein biosynthesis integral membrane protein MurJ [Actinobacteria bacterium 13_2_20CM_2_72_6]|nr:MAG: murein biosynthesis integral membrane protein MurJ [Actinobacteria bacterium 13_2_20CM_2_72_6]